MAQLFSNRSGNLSAAIFAIALADAVLAGGTLRCWAQSQSLSAASLTIVEPEEEPQELRPTTIGDSTQASAIPKDLTVESPEPLEPEQPEQLEQPAPEAEPVNPEQLGAPASSASQEDDPFADLFRDLPIDDPAIDDLPIDDPGINPAEPPLAPAAFEDALQNEHPAEQVQPSSQSSPLFSTFPSEHGYRVLVAAPVHEALISRYELPLHAIAAVNVPSPPPQELNEQPPVASSDIPQFVGNNVQWVGGYWAWLAEADKYVWISGVYRDVPPGRQWQPGQWVQSAEGYRWDSGYWAEADPAMNRTVGKPVRRTAPPPLALDGPPPPSPRRDSFWVPGVWMVQDANSDQLSSDQPSAANPADGYRWQKGFWAPRSDEWIWQPAHYVRTGDDYVFVSGYWDYEPHFRGQGYAAVDFGDAPTAASMTYRPVYPLCRPISALLHLFFKPGTRTVFYGDLYDVGYAALGYQPWYLPTESDSLPSVSESPLLSFYSWKYQAQGIDFISSMSRFVEHFRSAPSIRPAAQLAITPRLAYRDGLAGAVYANSFDAIVRGVVGGQSAVRLAGTQPAVVAIRSASKPSLSAGEEVTGWGRASSDSTAVITAAAVQPIGALAPPKGAVPLGLPGTSGLMVLPGGRIIAAPPAMPLGP